MDRIQLADDNYEGWICAKQYHEITYEDYDNLNLNEFPKVGDKLSYLEETSSGEKHHTTRKYTTYFHQGTIRIRQKKYKFKEK